MPAITWFVRRGGRPVGQIGGGPRARILKGPGVFLIRKLCHYEKSSSKIDGNSYKFLYISMVYFLLYRHLIIVHFDIL